MHIPELLALLFSHLDNRSLARAARVCKQWVDVALDALWHTVTDLRPLLSLLAPLTGQKKSTPGRTTQYAYIVRCHLLYPQQTGHSIRQQKFKRLLHTSDWPRCDRYAYRIRALDIDDRRPNAKGRQLDPSVFDEVERTCPRQDLLPNLISMSCSSIDPLKQYRSLYLLHSAVRQFTFHAHASQEHPLSAYVESIQHKAPLLTKLEVRSHHATHELQDDLLPLFRGLHGLRHVVIPLYFLTGALLATLAEVPRLETIKLAAPVERGIGDSADVQDLNATLQQGAFPALRTLALAAHIQQAARFLEQPGAPKRIAALHLHVLAVDTPPVVHDLFSTLASSYSQLTELRLDFMLGPYSPTLSSPPPPGARLSLETLRPLAACTRLKILEIRWDYELNLTEADLSTLAPCWSALEVLHLHSDAIPEHTPPQLSLRALLPFARHCPRLRSLAIYVDGDRAPLPPPGTPLPAFRVLGTLAFGSSPLRDPVAAALFLSALLPPSCAVSAGVRWPDAFGIALDRAGVTDERRLRIVEWWAHWNEVGRSVPLLVRARADERARVLVAAKDDVAGELEEEVKRLRVRMGG